MRRNFSIELITHFLKLISGHSSLQGKMQFCDRLSQLSTGKMLLRNAVRFFFLAISFADDSERLYPCRYLKEKNR